MASKRRDSSKMEGNSRLEGTPALRDQGGGPSELPAQLALTWIEHELMPRIIVDHELNIMWGNIAARSALAAKRDIEDRKGQLTTLDPDKQAELIEFVRSSEVMVSGWCLKRADGDGHLLFRAQRVDWSEGGAFGLSFYGSGSEFRARYADLDKVFGLTPTEHQVLNNMLDGYEADRLAGMHNVSIETTRTHIRNIYLKLQVNSREGLFHRLRPYRI